MKWLDATKITTDVSMFSPIINSAVRLVPGEAGTELSALLTALINPNLLQAAVAAINAASGAIPPS